MADKKIDPRLYIPLVEGYTYDDPILDQQQADADQIEVDLSGIDASLQPPDSVLVADQIFRKGADGRIIVDLVLEVQDVAGASEYEVRVASV